MGERLRLVPVSGGREMFLTDIRRTHFDRGGDSTKYQVTGTIDRRTVSYVERALMDTWVNNWRRFKIAGLPVLPELYRGSDGSLYLEDLTADGSEIYGKSLLHVLSAPNHQRESHPADARFLQLMQSDQREAIAEQIRKYVAIANEWGLTLPHDDAFDLIVHPQRAENPWELVILDLAQAGTFDLFDVETPHTVDEARAANQRRGDASFGYLKVLASKLRS